MANGMFKPINLQVGCPSTFLFPKETLIRAAQATLSDPAISNEALIYGPDSGHQPLREGVSKWLTKHYNPKAGPITADQIFIANGASAALSIILDKFTDPSYTRRIFMVEPTYFLACPIFDDAGFEGRLCGVPEDEEGIDIEYLEQALQALDLDYDHQSLQAPLYKSNKKYPKLYRYVIYAVPTFSNPSGKVMHLRRRKQLVELARKHDALVITDDVYDMLRWPAESQMEALVDNGNQDHIHSGLETLLLPPRLVDVDRLLPGQATYGNAISNGSFSKIIAPGVRVSWVESSSAFTAILAKHGATCSGGSPSQMSSIFIDHILRTEQLDEHINKTLIPTYCLRYHAMVKAIRTHLQPIGVVVDSGKPYVQEQKSAHQLMQQAGGFFTYLTLPNVFGFPTAQDIARVALESYSLKLAYGQMMVVAGDEGCLERAKTSFGRGLRLSWSWHNEEEIEEGVQRLAVVIRDMIDGNVKESHDVKNHPAELTVK